MTRIAAITPAHREHPYAPLSPVSLVEAGDVDHVFSEMEDVLHARDLIEDDADLDAFEIFAPAAPLPGGWR